MKPQKIFLLMMPLILVLQLLLGASIALGTALVAPPTAGAKQASVAQPAAAMAQLAQDDLGIIVDQVIVYGDRDQIDTVVAEFPLKPVGEPTDLSLLTPNWEMRRYQITDETPSDALAEKLNETAKGMDVDVHAEPNVEIGPPNIPGGSVHGSPGGPPLPGPANDPTRQWAWGKRGINLGKPAVKGSGVTVGVFDTCPNLTPAWVTSIDSSFLTPIPGAYAEHGASVAYLINQMASKAKIELYCVLNTDGKGTLDTLIMALIKFMTNHPNTKQTRAIINLSLSVAEDPSGSPDLQNLCPNLNKLLQKTLCVAHELGFVTTAAAGNNSRLQPDVPAAYNLWVLGVAGSNYKRQRSSFTNKGNVAAPAGEGNEDLSCTDLKNYIITRAAEKASSSTGMLCWRGGSFATAFVSGEAALILSKNISSKNPSLTAREVFAKVRTTVDSNPPIGTEPYFETGIINVTKALQ